MRSRRADPTGAGTRLGAPWRGVVAAFLGGLSFALALEFQQGAVISLQQFRTQGRTEQGARWYLDGQSAVVRGAIYDLTGVVLRVEDDSGRTAVIRSQACTYYQDSGLVESAAAVRVESGEITLEGVGFDMLMAERRLKIRDAVRMVIPGAKANLSAFSPTVPSAARGAGTESPAKTTP